MQTKAGGKKVAETIRRNHGVDFWKKIGAMGGSTKTDKLKGFAANRELASTAGRLGGQRSKRGEWTEAERTAHRLRKLNGKSMDIK